MKEKYSMFVNNRLMELKPCPFCGSEYGSNVNPLHADDYDDNSATYIFCPRCNLKMEEKTNPNYAAREMLFERWNHRV